MCITSGEVMALDGAGGEDLSFSLPVASHWTIVASHKGGLTAGLMTDRSVLLLELCFNFKSQARLHRSWLVDHKDELPGHFMLKEKSIYSWVIRPSMPLIFGPWQGLSV